VAQVRALTLRRWLEDPLLKFALFPLLPAAVAFRLHQVIAFGGPFGEYYTYGLKAWLTGGLIWWASWSLGLMLLAAVLRVVVETFTALALMLPVSTDRAAATRDALMWLARGAYYVGVPTWLGLRLTSG
jgi:apolipoprotein N-acyltransferase